MTWNCRQCGDCCRTIKAVIMTPAEAVELQRAAPDVPVVFREWDRRTVRLIANPCPYLRGTQCLVHAVRPYNCRRYLCFREPGEPFVDTPIPHRALVNPSLRRQYAANQRRAQGWARQHGWFDGR